MQYPFTVYDIKTGKIDSFGTSSYSQAQFDFEQMFPGKSVVDQTAENDLYFYVHDGVITQRPELRIVASKATLIADGSDEMVLSGFPVPCSIVVDGQEFELEADGLVLTSDIPTTYEITCAAWPFMDWGTTITTEEPST